MAFKFKEFFGVDNYYEEEVPEEQYSEDTAQGSAAPTATSNATRPTAARRPNVLKMDGSRSETSKIALYEPRTYADAQTIATQLLAGEAVIVNLGSIDENTGKRVLDYLGGTAFAVDGIIERVGERIFLATPHNFEISGTISQNLGQQFN
ncbi:cell division protein SepF [Weissella cibaria]|uniref:cell division protein SepF n=1 Tax=Weissella cibaria TaxID=137591 RepID=UPI00106DF171|nr:cell division protein SepF [Weissella cibaria]